MAVLTHLETDTGTNVDISAATAVGTYTANGDKLIMVDVSIDAVAGNGDYVMYVTRQIGGSGSAYRILPQTTMAAASGLTAISGQSGWITVRNGDVLTVYVDGLAGDTSTPDWSTRWFESAVTLVTLADDAITAAKFDESTAYPLKSADTIDTIDKKVSAFIDPDAYVLRGTGQEELDGIFRRVDDYVYYNQAGYFLERDSGAWRIYSPGPAGFPDTVFYTATSDAETPDLVDNWELGQHGELPLPEIGFVSAVRLASEQGRTIWKQVKIVDDVEGQGALVIENNGENGAGIITFGKLAGMVNYGDEYGQLNISEEGDTPVSGYDPAIITAIMSFMIDGFTFEQIVQIMASVLAGKLTRSGDTLTFRDLADTVNRVVAETDENKQRTGITYTV